MAEAGKEQKGRRSRIFVYGLVICCILAYLGVFALINLHTLDRFCNSDVYADMQVAKRMWEQKTLFPDGWIFGNQFYVIATPVCGLVRDDISLSSCSTNYNLPNSIRSAEYSP